MGNNSGSKELERDIKDEFNISPKQGWTDQNNTWEREAALVGQDISIEVFDYENDRIDYVWKPSKMLPTFGDDYLIRIDSEDSLRPGYTFRGELDELVGYLEEEYGLNEILNYKTTQNFQTEQV